MTLASELVFVSAEASLSRAEELAEKHNVRHLLVASAGELIGIVCRCDLVAPQDQIEFVGDCMTVNPIVLQASATLGEAAAIMAEERVGCLPVVDAGLLCGVITRGDLRRLGVAEQYLSPEYCVACGSVHGVTGHPKLPSVDFCLDCIEASLAPIEYEELGVGD